MENDFTTYFQLAEKGYASHNIGWGLVTPLARGCQRMRAGLQNGFVKLWSEKMWMVQDFYLILKVSRNPTLILYSQGMYGYKINKS